MLAKEKFCRLILKKKKIYLQILLIYFFSTGICFADLKKDIINKLTATTTLSFDFIQSIAENKENGKCIIKYPLLMKCDYKNVKQKTIISNGKSVAIIKKKNKKVYRYPIKSTPLFIILKKQEIINLVRKNKPTHVNESFIEYEFIYKKKNKLKILFDKDSLNFKGWETSDSFSNNVKFIMSNVITNKILEDNIFRIPQESEL